MEEDNITDRTHNPFALSPGHSSTKWKWTSICLVWRTPKAGKITALLNGFGRRVSRSARSSCGDRDVEYVGLPLPLSINYVECLNKACVCFCVKQSTFIAGAPSFDRIRWPENGEMAQIKRTVFFFFFWSLQGRLCIVCLYGFRLGTRAMKGSSVVCAI